MPSERVSTRRGLLRLAGATISTSVAGCVGGTVNLLDADPDLACSDSGQPFPDGWPLYGYDSRNTGANPNATGPKDEAEVRWTDGGTRHLWGTPVVVDETVYVQESPTRLAAFARADATEHWSVRLGTTNESKRTDTHSGPHMTPAVVGDTVYVGGGNVEVEKDGMESERIAEHVGLYAVNRHTGEVRWTVRPDDFVATAPVAVGDAVLFATLSGTVYGVDAEDESVAWTFSVEESQGVLLATPAVADCRLYLPTLEHGLYALDAETGDLDWRLPSVKSRSPPAVADETVYVGGADGVLYAVNPESESIEWQRDLGRAISTASPAVASGTVFVGTADGDSGDEQPRVRALDAETGERVWAADTKEYVNSSPAVADGVAYVAAHETVHGFDAESGDELWAREVHGGVSASLSVAGGTVFAATSYGQLYAFAEPE